MTIQTISRSEPKLICEFASVLRGWTVRLVRLPDGSHQSQRWYCGHHAFDFDMAVDSAQTILEYKAYAAGQHREAAKPRPQVVAQGGLWA